MARFSRSRSRSPRYSRRYSRSRSRSGTPPPSSSRGGGSRRRSHSRSPMSSRRRHEGNRDNPSESNCIGVFGLSLYTTERELEKEFSRFGPLQKVLIVLDNQTGRSRGFAFITFESQEDAKAAKAAMTDQEIDGRRIRVDYSVTKRAHTPTPGVYMGRPTYTDRGRGRGRGGYDRGSRGGGYDRGYERDYHGGHDRGYGSSRHYSRRSPSPYHRGPPPGRHYRSRSRSYSPRYRDSYY